MKKTKMKIWKIILIVFLALLIAFIAIVTRRVIILSNIDKKVTDCENNNKNIYIKTTLDYADYKSEIERFIKDDVDKVILKKTDLEENEIKLIQVTYPNERKVYTEKNGIKVMNVYNEKAPIRGAHIENLPEENYASYAVITNFAYSISIYERILSSILTSIKTVELDGVKCYELSSLHTPNYIYSENTSKLSMFVNKETGLPVKRVEVIKENGVEKENITTYECKFNIVTDEDIKEPDAEEYIMQAK